MGSWTLPSGHPSQVEKGSEKPVKKARGKASPDKPDSDTAPGAGGGATDPATPADTTTATETTGANTNEG